MEELARHFSKAGLLRYTLPTMAMLLMESTYSIVDGLFVSNVVGKTALASVTIVWPFIMVLASLGIMMGAGGSAVVGQLLGAGKRKKANQAFSLIVLATFVIGLICGVFGLVSMDQVVLLLGASPDMASMAALYGRIAFLSMPMFMLTYVLEMFAATAGKPSVGLVGSIVAGVSNIGLDALFMCGLGMGIEGAALATLIAEYASAILLVVLFARGKVGALKLVKPCWNPSILSRSMINGISEMVGFVAMSVVAVAYNLQLMSLYGENGVAAYAVIEYVSMLAGAAVGGLTEGTAPLMSFQHGARNVREKRSLFRNGGLLTAVMGVAAFVLAQVFAGPLAQVFTGYDAELSALTVHAFRTYSIAFLLMGATYFGSAMFTAVENGKISAVITFVHTFILELGSVILLPVILGADAIWWSIVVAEVFASALTLALVLHFGRRYGWLRERTAG